MSVLDVGAGTGLLTIEACRRVGASGSVIALDVSADALGECDRAARSSDAAVPALRLVVGDAVSLPLADACVDAVLARSVLVYVVDKAGAVCEFRRVLRPGGRVSIFEPINRDYQRLAAVDLSVLEPERSRVLDHWQAGGDPGAAMMGFDERDLVQYFVQAGFESVELTYERRYSRTRAMPQDVASFLSMRPNPNMVSYEEAARAVLGDAAGEHLRALTTILTSQLSTSVFGGAYVRCRHARR